MTLNGSPRTRRKKVTVYQITLLGSSLSSRSCSLRANTRVVIERPPSGRRDSTRWTSPAPSAAAGPSPGRSWCAPRRIRATASCTTPPTAPAPTAPSSRSNSPTTPTRTRPWRGRSAPIRRPRNRRSGPPPPSGTTRGRPRIPPGRTSITIRGRVTGRNGGTAQRPAGTTTS